MYVESDGINAGQQNVQPHVWLQPVDQERVTDVFLERDLSPSSLFQTANLFQLMNATYVRNVFNIHHLDWKKSIPLGISLWDIAPLVIF